MDVGCGIGKIAIPLTRFLSSEGSYEGFDIVPQGIRWCKKRLEPKFSNFHFQLVDVYNKVYNPKGKLSASEFRFPYDDNFFDFVFVSSVFTHMLTKDFTHYLSEISRVLKSDKGRCLVTYFLLNEQTMQLMTRGQSLYDFKLKADEECYAKNINSPEIGTAFNESFVLGQYAKYRLKVEELLYGHWRDDKSQPSHDTILARKY